MVVFDTDEEIMAYHGPLLFPARILEKTERAGGAGGSKVRLYRVHYDGWSSHWDEWVPESRLLKDDASARQLQKERIREFNRAFKKHKRSGTDGAGAAGEPPAADGAAPGEGGAAVANKRPRGGVVPADDSIAAEVREQLRLPQGLKLKLIEDWERVSREKARPAPCPRPNPHPVARLASPLCRPLATHRHPFPPLRPSTRRRWCRCHARPRHARHLLDTS